MDEIEMLLDELDDEQFEALLRKYPDSVRYVAHKLEAEDYEREMGIQREMWGDEENCFSPGKFFNERVGWGKY